jgi:hypothetical protein
MPKEVIKVADITAPEGSHRWREVQIGWSKDHSYVEVITRVNSTDEGFDPYDGKHGQGLQLETWQEVNNLIRNLQQARDGAFGRPA